MTSVGARRCGRDGARGARRHDRRASTRSAARSRNDVLAARRALAVVVAAQVSRRGDGRAATKLSVRMTSVGARRCGRDGARGARRHDRRASTRSAARSRNDVLAARRALAVVVAAQVSRRGDGRAATKLSVRMTSVGARRCGRDGARGARRHDRRASTRSTAARSRNDVLAARRALAVVVAAQVSRRGDGRAATKLSVRMTSVGARRCGRDGARGARRHDRRASTRSAARSRNDVLAARRALAVVVAAQVSRRGDGRAATKLSVRMTSVGARRCGRDGARGARRHDRRASTRSAARSRNDVLAARRALAVVVAAQVSRRGDGRAATKLSVRMTSVGARRCGRDGARGARRHDRRASTRSAARSRNDVLAARRALAVVVAAQVSRRGDGRAATKLSVRMTSVGARRCGRDGARGARRHDRRASTRSAARSRNDVLAARRALAVVVAAQVSRRGDGRAATKLSVRMTSVGARRCGRDGARGARRHDRRASTRSAARSRNDVLAARRALAVVVAAQVSRRGDGRAATKLSVRMTSVGARRCGRDGARGARRHDRRASTRSAARSRNDVLAARRALAVVVAAQVSRRGDGRAATKLSVRMTSVGARRCGRDGARGARRHDRRASTRSAARSRNDVLAARRALAVVVAAQVSRRGDGRAATKLSVRMTSVGARRCGRDGARGARRHDRRASTRSAARSRNDVLAARRALAVVVAARVSRRGCDGGAATKLSVRMTSVGARRCGRDGARGARRHDRRALDEVGGALKERRARGSARARRRRGGSSEPARGAMEEQQRS